MSCDNTGLISAVHARFLKQRYGIVSCSSDMDLDITDAKNQIEMYRANGGVCNDDGTVSTLPAYEGSPSEIVYCDPEPEPDPRLKTIRNIHYAVTTVYLSNSPIEISGLSETSRIIPDDATLELPYWSGASYYMDDAFIRKVAADDINNLSHSTGAHNLYNRIEVYPLPVR